MTFQRDTGTVSVWLETDDTAIKVDQSNPILKPSNAPVPAPAVPVPPSNPLDNAQVPDVPMLRRSTRQHTESPYIKILRAGVGTHDGREGDPLLPKGIQAVVTEGVEDEQALMAWELDNESTVFALLAGNAEAEGLEPSTINEAKTRPDWPKWEDAINAELKSLDDAHTWNMVERPKDTNVVSCKWVLKIKKNAAGKINKYKARLVVRGFMQQYGVDYDETYALVARLASLQLILAIAARHDWDINVFDFHSAFLNGKLDDDEVIYMELPPSFEKQDRNLVARLRIAIYGSKQGALKWYQCLYGTLQDLGFTRMEADWGVFIANIAEHLLILASHVDDCTITGSSSTLIKAFKDEIGTRF